MTLVDLLLATASTFLAGWLLASPEAHVTAPLRMVFTERLNRAFLRAMDRGHLRVTKFLDWYSLKFGCRVCMGLEPSVFAWLVTTEPWGRHLNPFVWIIEIAAINGLHLAAVKLTTRMAPLGSSTEPDVRP